MVYVIDDDTNVRRSLELLLVSYDMRCKAFASGREFLEHYRADSNDVMILDLKMIDMDSKEFLETLKDTGIGIPVIGITALDAKHIREYCKDLGVKNIMTKPVDSKALLDIIRYYGS